MERDVDDNNRVLLNDSDERPRSAVNSTVLDYYKKFGRKRDLEQYFSLSTAQSEIRDPASLFWRRMKEQSDTSDSGEKRSESSNEICRISIKCSIPEGYKPQKFDSPPKSDSESPPIITDAMPGPSHSGDDSVDDNHSQKSMDGTLDTSMNKPLSPTSSVTSQRKLEWDSLADVGYGNESDRKTSASSLSTLEREVLAQKQQYTLDMRQNSDLGLPTAHSTPVDPNDSKSKGKKGQGKKTMTFSKKDVDFVEVRVPQRDNAQAINVNLTKQFSVNLDKDGGITVDNVKKDVTVSPEKTSVGKEVSPQSKMDKVVQTSLLRSKEKTQSKVDRPERASTTIQKVPVLICLNTLKRRYRRKKMRTRKSKTKSKTKTNVIKETTKDKDKSGEQVSEAESFEYMPGHMYNQNQLDDDPNRHNNAGNKSSLESSAVQTTDSSKESKYSFTKDLEKSIDVLKSALKDKYDSNLKKKLVKEIIQRMLKSKYKDDDSTPDFLSVLSLTSKKTPTTSTSEADNTGERVLHTKPKKSILRVNKFNSHDIASTSQSAPNLPSVMNSEKPVVPYLLKLVSSSTTDTDVSAANSSAKDISSDTVFAKTSSEELYKKYIDALKREEAYKQHLKDKELFLRQKLVRSDTALKLPTQLDVKVHNRLKELIKDLTRNNYDDGSGDASKLEGGSSSNFETGQRLVRKQRSHSVFTLSSSNSDIQNRRCTKSKEKREIATSPRPGPSNYKDNCNCSSKKALNKPNVTDSSVQVSIKFTDNHEKIENVGVPKGRSKTVACATSNLPEEVQYVCLCSQNALSSEHHPDEFLIYKCSRLTGEIPVKMVSKASNTTIGSDKCTSPRERNKIRTMSSKDDKSDHQSCCPKETNNVDNELLLTKMSKSSQTNIKLDMPQLLRARSAGSSSSSEKTSIHEGIPGKNMDGLKNNCGITFFKKPMSNENNNMIQESTRCLQTEISIHPKISDPSVSDINIINSAECVKLISELYRKVSGSSSENNASPCLNDKYDANTNNNKSDRSSKDTNHDSKGSRYEKKCGGNFSVDEDGNTPLTSQQAEKDEVPQSCFDSHHESPKQPDNISDNIVIPIQGTNMTLKVCIGSLKSKEKQETLNTGVVTDKIENDEKFTSIAAECSKAVQSKNLGDVNKTADAGSYDSNTVEEKQTPRNNDSHLFRKPSYPSNPARAPKCNTYPKVAQINDNKPLLRCNTDTGNLGASFAIQTDKIDNSDKETQSRHLKSKQEEKANSKDLIPDNNCGVQSQKFKENFSAPSTSENSKSDSERKSNSSSDKNKTPVSESQKTETCSNIITNDGTSRDLILDMIQDITKRYSKTNVEKSSKKKCFKEIITVLNYLLDTDDSGDSTVGEQEESQGSKKSKPSNKQYRESKMLCYREAQDTSTFKKAIERNELSPRKRKECSGNAKSDAKNRKTNGKCGNSSMNASPEITKKSSETTDPFDRGDLKCKSHVDSTADTPSNSSSSKFDSKIVSSKPPTCDKGCECGCEESSECKEKSDYQRENAEIGEKDEKSLRSKKQEANETLSKTCDKACECGCDDFECNVVSGHECEKNKADKSDKQCSNTSRPKKQETKKDLPKTCDKACGCGCDDFECKDISDHDCRKNKASDKQCLKSKEQQTNKDLPKTCDMACECGCDDSSECKDSSDNKYSKNKTVKGNKQCLKSNINDTKGNLPKTNDKACGYEDSSECKESSDRECFKNNADKGDKQFSKSKNHERSGNSPKKLVSKCVQSTARKVKSMYCHRTDSSDVPVTSDQPTTSTDSPTARIINKIKKECEKYQKRCKGHCGNKFETSSSASVNCDRCNRTHQCSCKGHKCRSHRTKTSMEKVKKKCVAYNLILQTSDSMISEETCFDNHRRPLQNIVVRVPSRKQDNIPFKEMAAKIEQKFNSCSPRSHPKNRSRSWPNEGISSTDDVKMAQACTVRDYLERNRPDFVERCATRQNCIRMISESRTSERSRHREVLSMQLGSLPTLNEDELQYLAKELGLGRRQPYQPKIISEREMKKHSQKIYKSLPEVVQKKEDARKESIKRTNLLMASIFKKNLQKKTLRGAVNLSNYSAVIKI